MKGLIKTILILAISAIGMGCQNPITPIPTLPDSPVEITTIGIVGLVSPVNGKIMLTASSLESGSSDCTISSLSWNPATSTYQPGTTYVATIVLTSASGHKFPVAGITPTVDAGTAGNGSTAGGDTSGNTLTFTITFPQTMPTSGINVGDLLGGGVVAYVLVSGDPGFDSSVQHGFITTADSIGYCPWSLSAMQGTTVPAPGAAETAIGTGLANTNSIVAQNDPTFSGLTTYAAGAARFHRDGGYNDWHLPSKDELAKLYANRATIGNFISTAYWSSTEYDQFYGWYHNFGMSGVSNGTDKYQNYSVRPVRYF